MSRATADTAPAIVFLVLYTAVLLVLGYLYATKAVRWKSRYSFLLFHVVMRVVGMALGVAFSCLTWQNGHRVGGFSRPPAVSRAVLIAYIVFAAEGYFSLILCASRFLIVWQQDRLGRSNLEPRIPKGTPVRERLRAVILTPMTGFEYTLIVANAIIVAGSSIMAGAITNPDRPNAQQQRDKGKAMRVAGVAIFVALVQVVFAVAWQSYRKRGDRTLALIILTWPFLTVRGIYGILSVVIASWSYSNPAAYSVNGFSTSFLVAEYVMGVAMEWVSCMLLLSTHFSALNGGKELVEDHNAQDTDKLALTDRPTSEAGDVKRKDSEA